MWWNNPLLKGFPSLIPMNILHVITRAYAVVEVGGLSGSGPERGRNFEKVFYAICDRRSVHLCERAGAISLAGQRSASGFRHEVDGATRSASCLTHWELKHLTTDLSKNELLIFNGKGLDFLYGSSHFFAQIPIRRFLLSGSDIRDECRKFGALWGIMIIEPGRLPLPLLYEAIARGAARCLSDADCDAVRNQVAWACRPLQAVLQDLVIWSHANAQPPSHCGPAASRIVNAVMDIQEQIGADVTDYLEEEYSEWIDELANDTWMEVNGW